MRGRGRGIENRGCSALGDAALLVDAQADCCELLVERYGEGHRVEARLASRFPRATPVIGRALPAAGALIGVSLAPEQVGYVIDGKWNAKDVEAIAGLTSTGVAAYMAIAGATGPVGWAIGGTAAVVGLAAYHFADHSEEDAAKQLQTDVHDLLAGHVAEGGGHGGGH